MGDDDLDFASVSRREAYALRARATTAAEPSRDESAGDAQARAIESVKLQVAERADIESGVWREESLFVGPLPPPEVLQDYDQAVPGLANRLVTVVEEEVQHRRRMEEGRLRLEEGRLRLAENAQLAAADISRQELALQRDGMTKGERIAYFGFAIALGAGVLVGPLAGAVLGGAHITAIVTVFVVGRRSAAKSGHESEAPSKEGEA